MKRLVSTTLLLVLAGLIASVVPLSPSRAQPDALAQNTVQTAAGEVSPSQAIADLDEAQVKAFLNARGVSNPLVDQPEKLLMPMTVKRLEELGLADTTLQDGGESFQRRGFPGDDWEPDDPWTQEELEEMDLPDTDEVREAIRYAVNYVLDQQTDQGQWDVELNFSLLGQTADQAVDAVAATALAGLALRPHYSFAPDRIDEALEKGASFIMNSIFRGKLSTRIYYAIWRYTLGLRFLCQEYRLLKEDQFERKDEMRACAYRMVSSIVSMQFSADGQRTMANRRRARVSGGAQNRPTTMGLILQAPTAKDFRGGAEVIGIEKGSAAEEEGFKVGDRIVQVEGVRVENAVDFYNVEASFVENQSVRVRYIRPSDDPERRVLNYMKLPERWPASLGVFGETAKSGRGVRVDFLMIGSPLEGEVTAFQEPTRRNPVAKEGDIILEVEGEEVNTEDEIEEAMKDVDIGDRVKIEVLRPDGDDDDIRVEAMAAPNGEPGFRLDEEDKEVGEGVLIGICPEGYPAYDAGLRDGDRITHVNGIPILGFDHYNAYITTQWAGKDVAYRVKGKDEDIEVSLRPTYAPGDLQIQLDTEEDKPIIADVTKRGVSYRKLRRGDEIVSLAFEFYGRAMERETPTKQHVYGIVNQLVAGMEIVVKVRRGTNVHEETITLAEKKSDPNVLEEGGWNYYPDLGHAMSFVTAYVLIALMEAEETFEDPVYEDDEMEFEVPDEVTDSAAEQIAGSRFEDSNNDDAEGYIYREGTGKDIRGHMGRIVLCDLALEKYGHRRESHVEDSLELWIKHREELDKVRTFVMNRNGPHYYDLYANAAYYWMYGHYWAMEGANAVGGDLQERTNETVLKAMMLNRRDNDLWLGHAAFGDLCGTCEALMIFGQLQGEFRKGGAEGSEDDEKYADPDAEK